MKKTIYPSLKERIHQRKEAAGALAVTPQPVFPPAVGLFDVLVMVFCDKPDVHDQVSSYLVDRWKVKELWVPFSTFMSWMLSDEKSGMVHWALEGEILYDPNRRVERLCSLLREFPPELRQKKICVEFAGFLRHYMESRYFLRKNQLLDAYVSLQKGLQYWARLAIIDSGQYPRPHLWTQIKPVNPGIFKLYQELVSGKEPLEKRLRLVLLAAEYSILSKLEEYCSYLLNLIGTGNKYWSVQQLCRHLELEQIELELTLVLQELVKRSLVEEVVFETGGVGERRYRRCSGERTSYHH